MYIHRNRPAYTPEELSQVYAEGYDHSRWEDHVQRVQDTISFARRMALYGRVADLSCGDGTIALALSSEAILGDITPKYPVTGPLESTISVIPFVDVYICTETLEHLDNPLLVLQMIRNKTRQLLLSTPVHNPGDIDENPEHYWTWDREGVEDLLHQADFRAIAYTELQYAVGYRYGVWAAQ